jgi:hypothetical protein
MCVIYLAHFRSRANGCLNSVVLGGKGFRVISKVGSVVDLGGKSADQIVYLTNDVLRRPLLTQSH